MNCEQVQELLEAGALGGLDRSEQRKVQRHIVACDDCRRLFDDYSRVAALLSEVPLADSNLEAPASLKSKVIQQAAGGERTGSLPSVAASRLVGPLLSPQVAALVLVTILLALSVLWTFRQTSALARERSLRTDLQQYIGQQEILLELVDSPRTTKASLRAVEPQSTAYGKLYTRPDFSQVVAMAGRLPLPEEGLVYNLWLTRSGVEELAGPMPVNENGFALILFDAGREGPVYEAARVVRQPDDSTTPDGSTVIRWEAPR